MALSVTRGFDDEDDDDNDDDWEPQDEVPDTGKSGLRNREFVALRKARRGWGTG